MPPAMIIYPRVMKIMKTIVIFLYPRGVNELELKNYNIFRKKDNQKRGLVSPDSYFINLPYLSVRTPPNSGRMMFGRE